MQKVVVIGAGIGGLAAAAILCRAGLDVIVLEAHIYPGGCAGTFYHQGYRFDAGATLAGGFYPGGPLDVLAKSVGIAAWPGRPANPAMIVHLPDGSQIARWGDERRWEAYRAALRSTLAFWRRQERTSDKLWDLALRLPSWPPQNLADLQNLAAAGLGWLGNLGSGMIRDLPHLALDGLRSMAVHSGRLPDGMQQLIDAQLLISGQAESQETNALYAAAALDLPRQGVMHLEGGMGTLANLLVEAIRREGGQVLFRKEATRIRLEQGKPVAVETRRREYFETDLVIANLTPWNVQALMDGESSENLQPGLRALPSAPPDKWGAFTAYIGLDGARIPAGFPLHHQVISRRPLGEGNTLFLSISPEWDEGRAPAGKRALTISTHTHLDNWHTAALSEPAGYQALRTQYLQTLLAGAEKVIPGLNQAAELVLPATPLTFQRFARRARGWVGGFQQTSLRKVWGPRLGKNLWMVGDSIFPGQSVAAAALGGMRVARTILEEQRMPAALYRPQWKIVG